MVVAHNLARAVDQRCDISFPRIYHKPLLARRSQRLHGEGGYDE